ncbi:MAG: NUDIX hydrolase [Gammaproteobacteria bacterium]|nr:NUDIX hydrolase [Gammaproteobacteria bacterium]MDH5629938.1 NUDIX hydrolase [Gammaproteobacteria bacterium]
MMDVIHVTVAAIIRKDNQYLLVKEKSSQGEIVYNQPAGHVELEESLIDGIIREVREETGLDFIPGALTGTYLLSTATNGKTYLRFCFVGDIPLNQVPSPIDPDIIENVWMTAEEIFDLPLKSLRSGLVLKCLQDYLKGIRIPLESLNFSNDEFQMIDRCIKDFKKS